MTVRYREWAASATGPQALKFRQLADATEKSVRELEEILRR